MGNNIFVVHTEISPKPSVGLSTIHRPFIAFGYGNTQHNSALPHVKRVDTHLLRRDTAHLRSLLHHIGIFFRTYTCNISVILHPDK